MASTPTQTDVAIIRERMRQIRFRLPQRLSDAKKDVERLTDWKFYVRRYPALVLPMITLASFALVPKKRPKLVEKTTSFASRMIPGREQEQEKVAKRSFLAGVLSAVAGLAFRSATSFAISRASGVMSELVSGGPAKNNRFSSEVGVKQKI